MKSTLEIFERISKSSKEHPKGVFTRLYRYLLRPEIYFIAYKNLYANKGATTKGINNDTADGFSKEYISNIIDKLASLEYKPKPVKRVYIPKTNGKFRPLGIPTFMDKLIQEAIRMILEAIYEPVFSYNSHGFRPNKSCHTALKQISRSMNGVNWFIEGDIKGCFDNINHKKLLEILGNKIKDSKFINLIHYFLKAGYMENWIYNSTYSGTPQGGIISPILANIYLNELDKKANKIKQNFDKKALSKVNPKYSSLMNKIYWLKRKINEGKVENREKAIKEVAEMRMKLLKTQRKDNTEKRFVYVRYADDWLIGLCGSKEDCINIKNEISDFLNVSLKLELSEEKTLITHSSQNARFLGYDIMIRRNQEIRKNKNGVKCRSLNLRTVLNVPLKDKIEKFLKEQKIVSIKSNEMIPKGRKRLLRCTDLEIISTYNSEIRGLLNYYSLATNYTSLQYFCYLMEYSCLSTLKLKHQFKSWKATINKYRIGSNWAIPYITKSGRKLCSIVKLRDCKNSMYATDKKSIAINTFANSRNTFEDMLNANICELCGTEKAKSYEIHHINKVKNLKGKEYWEQVMIAKRRKTIVVCKECHTKIHRNNNYIKN